MRGSVVKRGDGYSVVVELDRDLITAKRRQKWRSGYRTKRETERALTELLAAVDKGTYVPKSRQTLRDFIEEWLAALASTVRPSTHYSYSRNLRLHAVPRIGSAPLVAVDAGTLNTLYAALLANGRKDYAAGGLSPRTVRYIHTIIHRALQDAVRWGRLARNPADAADPPKAADAGRPDSITWSADQLPTFLEGTRASRHWTATFCWRPPTCDAVKCWACAGVTLTSMLAAHRSANRDRCQAHSDARHTQDGEGAADGHPR